MRGHSKIIPVVLIAVGLLVGAAPDDRRPAEESSQVPPIAPAAIPSATPESDPNTLDLSLTPSSPSVAETPSAAAASYGIDWYSINGGGTVNASSASYKMGASIGQSVAGTASSASYNVGIGFWYGAGTSGNCACDCHADPAPIGSCDGVQDVLDVVQMVNVAFRGAASILDPNVNCPYETTDVNCSASTDVLDVVRIVNVAFRGADPNSEFCDPCA